MPWYALNGDKDPQLDELAKKYNLHPLHIEDVRSSDERIKVDQSAGYTFAVLKPMYLTTDDPAVPTAQKKVAVSTLDIFAGTKDGEPFFITIGDPDCPATQNALARARREGADVNSDADMKPGRLLYLILDTIVDLYFEEIDYYDDCIDELEDKVVDKPEPTTLQEIFATKRQLIALRRILVGTRDATLHLQRDPHTIVDDEHQPFARDIYDHVVRLLDSTETQRDLVNNALDIYLSSVANRTNDVMKVLTIISTIALPALAITGIYGMNLKGLPFEDNPHGAKIVAIITVVITLLLLWFLRKRRWL